MPAQGEPDCAAWPGEPHPLPTTRAGDPMLSQWALLRTRELLARAREARGDPEELRALIEHAACIAPDDDGVTSALRALPRAPVASAPAVRPTRQPNPTPAVEPTPEPVAARPAPVAEPLALTAPAEPAELEIDVAAAPAREPTPNPEPEREAIPAPERVEAPEAEATPTSAAARTRGAPAEPVASLEAEPARPAPIAVAAASLDAPEAEPEAAAPEPVPEPEGADDPAAERDASPRSWRDLFRIASSARDQAPDPMAEPETRDEPGDRATGATTETASTDVPGDPIASVAAAPVVSSAPPPRPDIAAALVPEIEQAERLIYDARFRASLAALEGLRVRLGAVGGDATLSARVEILAATAELALGRADAARASFWRALDADPALELDTSAVSPKVRRAFEDARSAWESEQG